MLKEILNKEEEELIRIVGDLNAWDGFIGGREAAEERCLMSFVKKHNAKIIKAVREEELKKSDKFKDKVELVFSQFLELEKSKDIIFTPKAKKVLDDFIKTQSLIKERK